MSCDCYVENPPEFFSSFKRKSRKQRRCCECLGEISVGDMYTTCSGKWDGEFSYFSTCELCQDLRNRCDFECCPFGYMVDEASEYRQGDDMEISAFINRRRSNYEQRS